jgi:sugar phosphate isomerase/epimerase
VNGRYEIVRRADRPNGGILFDTWHPLRGPDRGDLRLNVPGDLIFAVQVNDVRPEPGPDVAAEGVGDIAGMLRALRTVGCTAPLSVEVFSDELDALPAMEVARRAATATRRVLAQVGEPVEG